VVVPVIPFLRYEKDIVFYIAVGGNAFIEERNRCDPVFGTFRICAAPRAVRQLRGKFTVIAQCDGLAVVRDENAVFACLIRVKSDQSADQRDNRDDDCYRDDLVPFFLFYLVFFLLFPSPHFPKVYNNRGL